VVRRLVQDQQVRVADQEPRQRCPHAPAPGQLGRVAALLAGCEPKAREDAGDLRVQRVAAELAVPLARVGVPARELERLRLVGLRLEPPLEVGEPALERDQLGRTVADQRRDAREPTGEVDRVLREPPEPQVARAVDLAGGRRPLTDERAQQRRLPRAVPADDGDPLPDADREIDVAQQGATADLDGDPGGAQRAQRSDSDSRRGARVRVRFSS
jgi:hypothetical protein